MNSRATAFGAMCVARFREFSRESEVIFWSFIFPIILSVGLGLAFRNRPPEVLSVAVVEPAGGAAATALAGNPLLRVSRLDAEAASRALRLGQVVVTVIADAPDRVTYRLDPARPEAVLARARVDEALQRAAGRSDPVAHRDDAVSEPGARYIDYLIPGLIGMNLINGGMWGVGFNLVDMRIKKLLKRLLATPMRRADFLAAQMTVRLVFMLIEVTFLLAFGRFVFGVPIRGSWPAIFTAGAFGALCAGGMGLLVAARPRRIEAVMGLMNVVVMPMFVCSGVFFSWERFPQVLHPLIRVLPLTVLNDMLRALILEGASLASQGGGLVVLTLWGVGSFLLGLKLFRWT